MAEFDVIGVEYRMNGEAYEQGLKELVAANQKLAAASGKTSEQIQQDMNQTAQATQKLKAETTELINEQDKLESGSKSLKAQLRQLKNELALMSEEDPGFLKMAIAAGKLEDKIGDVQQQVKHLASDERIFNSLTSAATGLAGAFSAVEGATALLGAENQDLQKALLRVNGAMALANGIQQTAQSLNKTSALRVELLTAKTALYNFVVDEGTKKLKLWNLAIVASGVGLAIVAISALISNWDRVKSILVNSVNPETEEYVRLTDLSAKAAQNAADSFDEQERHLKLLGYTEKEVNAEKVKSINLAQDETHQQILRNEMLLEELKLSEKIVVNRKGIYLEKRGENDPEVLAQKEKIANLKKLFNKYDDDHKQLIKDSDKLDEDASKKRDDDAKKEADTQLQQQRQTQQAGIDLMDDGIMKEMAQAQLAHDLKMDQLKGNHEAELLEEERYYKELSKIRKKYSHEEIKRVELKSTKEIDKEIKKDGEQNLKDLSAKADAAIERNKKAREQDLENQRATANARIAIEQSTFAALSSLGELFIQDSKKYSQFQKTLALIQIGINTARAISDLTAVSFSPSNPANLATGGLAGIASFAAGLATILANVAQAKAILSQSPAFAEGVIDLKGPGTGTSDSIVSRLSRGESVMTARETKEYKDELYAIRRGEFQDLITTKYVLPQLKAAHEARTTGERMAASMALQFDDSEINYHLKKNRKEASKDIQWLAQQLTQTIKETGFGANKRWKN